MIRIVVVGTPAPQGSKRAFVNQYTGKPSLVESSKKVKPWREAVRSEAVTAMSGRPPLDGAITLDVAFYFARPKGHYRTGRNAHLLRDAAPIVPTVAPDLSKLVRSTEDALTDAAVWVDDARVSTCVAHKLWTNADHPQPGAVITVRAYANEPETA